MTCGSALWENGGAESQTGRWHFGKVVAMRRAEIAARQISHSRDSRSPLFFVARSVFVAVPLTPGAPLASARGSAPCRLQARATSLLFTRSESALAGSPAPLTPPAACPMILLLKQNLEATDGVIREAVRQPAGLCIPLLRPHRHPWLPERLVPPRAGGLLFPRCRGRARGRQDRPQSANRRVSAMGSGIRSQSPDPHRVGSERCPQRGVRPAVVPPPGAGRPLWRLLHFPEHGAGRHFPLLRSQVPDPGSKPSDSAAAAQPVHALLLLL